MRTVCIVQARLGSKRLPGKVLLPLNGHTVIGEVLTRCKKIPGVDGVVCAVPNGDDALAAVALKYAPVVHGDELDVLARFERVAQIFKPDIIMRVTGDCPLISPELCGEVLSALQRSNADYASNIEPRTFPQGMDCEVFTKRTLERARWRPGSDEHVTTWMRQSNTVKRVNVRSPWPIEGRLTLDTEDDYRVICAYFGHKPYEAGKRIQAA